MRKELGYLTLGLTPLLLITLAQGPLLRYQTSFQLARQQYLDSLQDSRRDLADLGHQMRELTSLTNESPAAAGRTLNGFIVPGKIDHIAIYNQDCQLVANSEQGVALADTCPVTSLKNVTAAHFQFHQAPHAVSYDYFAPLNTSGDKSYYLFASNYLNDQWLFHHQDFKANMNLLDLSLGEPQGGKVLYKETTSIPGAGLATLSSNHPLLKYFPSLLRGETANFKVATGFAVALFIVCLAMVIRELRKREADLRAAIQKLHHWADELMPEGGRGGRGGEGGGPGSLLMSKGLNIQVLQDRMSRLVKASMEATDRVEHEKRLLQQQLVRLESRYLEQQAEQAWMSKTRSMHNQMHTSAEAYIAKLLETQSLGEDLSHLASHEIVRPAQRIMQMMNRWQDELAQVSSRKFVRSLSERVDEQGVSELDESIEFLRSTGQQLNNAAINVTLLTQGLLKDLAENTHMAKHWFQMMGHDNSIAKTLLGLMKDAQSLIEMQDKSITYENAIAEDISVDYLKIPTSALTSTLFHCQMALLENGRDHHLHNLGISNQLRVRDDKVILVCSLRSDVDELSLQKDFSPKAEQHLSLALQMMQGYAIRVTKLPVLNGVQALALMWEAVDEAEVAPRPEAPKAQPRAPRDRELT